MERVTEPGKLPGFKIALGGVEYIIPALNIEGVEKHEDDIEKVQTDKSLKNRERLHLMCGVVLTSLQRNYPEMTMEVVKKGIDLGNVRQVFAAVMGESGFTEGAAGE